MQFKNNADALATTLLRGAACATSASTRRATVPSVEHHHTLQLYREEEWPGHPVRVYWAAAYSEGKHTACQQCWRAGLLRMPTRWLDENADALAWRECWLAGLSIMLMRSLYSVVLLVWPVKSNLTLLAQHSRLAALLNYIPSCLSVKIPTNR